MTGKTGQEVIDQFEDVLVENLGDVGRFLLAQQLAEIGKTKETFTQEDINKLIEGIKEEFSKVIGYGVDKLEIDLRKSIRGE